MCTFPGGPAVLAIPKASLIGPEKEEKKKCSLRKDGTGDEGQNYHNWRWPDAECAGRRFCYSFGKSHPGTPKNHHQKTKQS